MTGRRMPAARHRPPTTTADALAARVESLLRPHVVPARRAFLSSGYAPTQLSWLGVPVPAIRRVVRELTVATAEQSPAAMLRLTLAVVKRGSIEARQVGYELIARRPDVLALVDRAMAERLGRGNDNWASVDAFATSVTGPAWRLGYVTDADLLGWARAADPWWRRTALVSAVALNLVSRGGKGDTRRTLLVCRAVTRDVTPMIGKALSWALRSLAPHDPASVVAFIDRYRDKLPAVVIREVETKVRTGKKVR